MMTSGFVFISMLRSTSGEVPGLSSRRGGFESRTEYHHLGVAEPGTARALGARVRWFKSSHPDHLLAGGPVRLRGFRMLLPWSERTCGAACSEESSRRAPA